MTHESTLSLAGSPVYIDQGIWILEAIIREIALRASLHVLCDNNTHTHCLPKLPFLHAIAHDPIIISHGESAKNLVTCEYVWRELSAQKASRKSALLNIGGGVLTDLGGFCAATYQRGIDFIHIPTTLLGMCDGALGGKVGVNFDGLKNYLGVFQQPRLTWIQSDFLQTLSSRHIRNGLAEIIKHALIHDPAFFSSLETFDADANPDWRSLLTQSAFIKRHFVENDFHEHGLRAALNFGHTFGHALESYALAHALDLLHGECVAIGMILETWLAHIRHGSPDREMCMRITRCIQQQVPVQVHAEVSISALFPFLAKDKKVEAKAIRFSLIHTIGTPLLHQECGIEQIGRLADIAVEFLPWLKP